MKKKSVPNYKLFNSIKSMFNLVFGVLFFGAAIFYISNIPIVQNKFLFPLLFVVNGTFITLISKYMLRNQFGMIYLTVVFSFSQMGFLFASMYGGMLSYSGMLFYLLPLILLASYGVTKILILTFLLSILPEAFMWFNKMSLGIDAIPTPLTPVGMDLGWNDFWSIWGSNAVIILAISFQISFMKTSKTITRSQQDSTKHVNKKETKKPMMLSDFSSDLRKLEKENRRLKENRKQNSIAGSTIRQNDSLPVEHMFASLVYFASGVFDAHSVLGFVSADGGRTFTLNGKFSRSERLKNDIVIFPGSGLVGRTLLEAGDFVSGNIATFHEELEYYQGPDEVKSLMVSKLIDDVNSKVLGFIVVDHRVTNKFNDSHRKTLKRLSEIAAKLISNARLSAVMAEGAKQTDLVYEITKKISAENYVRGVVKVLVENLLQPFKADRVVLCDFQLDSGTGRIMRVGGDPGILKAGMTFDIEDPKSVYGSAFLNKHEYMNKNFNEVDRYRFGEELEGDKPQEIIIAPLLDDASTECIAVIGLESNTPGVLDDHSLILLQTILMNASSVIGRAKLFQKIEKQAAYDGLTKIPNHRSFQDQFRLRLQKTKKENKCISMLLMDIDHFKNFNDSYGHPLGDRVLREVAKVLKNTIREFDYPARYGGEEFVAILDDADIQMSFTIAERVREMIAKIGIFHEEKVLSVTVSIGIATFPTDGLEQQKLIDMSDKAMYFSKETGRNRCTHYSTLPPEARI